jgi:hypothetical protein
LPQIIRPPLLDPIHDDTGLQGKVPIWANRQSHTLRFRYYNIQMVLYRPFLLYVGHKGGQSHESFDMAVAKCVSAATKTIELMHHMFRNFSYFRTWWYNTTYTLYAASILVFRANKTAALPEIQGLLRLIQMSIDILKIMDENIVAKKAAALVNKACLRIRERVSRSDFVPLNDNESTIQSPSVENAGGVLGALFDPLAYDPFDEGQLDIMTQLFPLSADSDWMWGETNDPTQSS